MGTIEGGTEERNGIEPRTRRALTRCMSVLPDGPRVAGADGMYEVVSESGKDYIVDLREGRCECPDHQYRGVRCQHIRRVAFALGDVPIPAGISGADPSLGEHTATGPIATDGGEETEECEDCMDDMPCWPCYRDGRRDFPEE